LWLPRRKPALTIKLEVRHLSPVWERQARRDQGATTQAMQRRALSRRSNAESDDPAAPPWGRAFFADGLGHGVDRKRSESPVESMRSPGMPGQTGEKWRNSSPTRASCFALRPQPNDSATTVAGYESPTFATPDGFSESNESFARRTPPCGSAPCISEPGA
jgi:hypothetical protein